MSATRAPILVFAYRRQDLLARMLLSLMASEGFAESRILLFVDGAKGKADLSAVKAVREYVTSLNLPNAELHFSPVNRGLRESISRGVSEACSRFGRAIVLEDDLVLSPQALNFFHDGLERFANDGRIWSIGGYTYDAAPLWGHSTALVVPYAHPWGWATWARAWDHFNLSNAPSPRDLRSRSFRAAFDVYGLYPFSDLLEHSLRGETNSWFVHWYYTIFRNGGRSIFPARRLVDNYGFEGGGTHNSWLNPYDLLVRRPPLFTGQVEFEGVDTNAIDYWAIEYMKRGHELRVQRAIARAGKAKRALKRLARWDR